MSYVKDNLLPNEKILFAACVHPAVFLPSALMFVMAIGLFIYGLSSAAVVSEASSPPPQATTESLLGSLLVILSVFLFLYSIILGLRAMIVMLSTEFAVTNRRVIAKTGFIRRHTLEMLLSKIESVSVNQNVLGRILNFGTVIITGTGGTKENFKGIFDPIQVRKKIDQIIEGYMQYQQKFSSPDKEVSF